MYDLNCPVCGMYSFNKPDDKEACHICGWKNDKYQFDNPESDEGINGISLKEYKKKFIEWMHI